MRHIQQLNAVVFTLILTVSMNAAAEIKLDAKLEPFRAFIGTWQAPMNWGKDKGTVLDVAHWQAALNGKALKTVHSVNDGDYGGESFIFWDKKTKSYKSFYFTTADFYTEATIKLEGENKFSILEKVEASSGGLSSGISEVKSTCEMINGELHMSTSYLKNGSWTKPETRRYTASKLKPKFKHEPLQ
ncbi:hypothetical protein [uncultured Pseudoteredinibacter sp.]|uniref:hypothetical protein n=1 Tax=uncultured Pseudoteredinibacter sp. TaxID=1641701 RepID=UPI0026316D34|nr:hypothetical protein [uncultured Pseudoteredinibacter sp.]